MNIDAVTAEFAKGMPDPVVVYVTRPDGRAMVIVASSPAVLEELRELGMQISEAPELRKAS